MSLCQCSTTVGDKCQAAARTQHCRKEVRASATCVRDIITSFNSQVDNHTSLPQDSSLSHHVYNSLWAEVLKGGVQLNCYMHTLLLGARWDRAQQGSALAKR